MRFAINDGHTVSGTTGSGAVGHINESNETRELGKLVRKYIEQVGHTAINCTVDKATSVDNSLQQIVALEKKSSADYFVSIHFNAGGGKGTEVYAIEGASSKTRTMATKVCDEVVSVNGFTNRGVKYKNFYVLRNTLASAILVEVCFVDSDDYKKYNRDKTARAIVKALTGKTVPTTSNSTSSGTMYRVVVGSYSDRNNAVAMQEKLKKAGFDSFLATT